jgi:hypothetical protein
MNDINITVVMMCAWDFVFFELTDDERFQIVLEFNPASKPTLTIAFETIEELKEWSEAFENATEALATPPPAEVMHKATMYFTRFTVGVY